MNIRQLILQLGSSFFLVRLIRQYQHRTSLLKVNAAQAYIHAVKKARLLFLGILFILVAFAFFMNGLTLLQLALLTYSSLSNDWKFLIALSLGGLQFFAAIGIMMYLLSESTWARFCEINTVVTGALGQKGRDDLTR